MALNINAFKTRTLTAAVFVVVMLAGLLWNHWSFFILFSIIHFGCWHEFQKLVALIDPDYKGITPFHKYGFMLAGWCIMLHFTNDAFVVLGISLHSIGWWLGLLFVFLMPIVELLFAKEIRLKNIGYSLVGLIYISLSWGLMIDIRCRFMDVNMLFYRVDIGFILPLLIIGSIWINDTMAYIVGSLIGKTPLSKISPKKTWEGTIGGILLAVIVMGILNGLSNDFEMDGIAVWMIIAAIASIMGTLGDLLESKLKRAAEVKDSGTLMPGHGGFLDRFDSLLVATPFVWLYIVLAL